VDDLGTVPVSVRVGEEANSGDRDAPAQALELEREEELGETAGERHDPDVGDEQDHAAPE